MKCFEENNCRLCTKTFCCRNCRYHHEETFHNINPDCEICVYGRATINEASVSLLNHIKSAHWPLHCVFCKKIFNTLDELIPHGKCAFRIDNMIHETPKTPVSSVTEEEQPSPEVTPFYKNSKSGNQQIGTTAFTSTPLIRKDENIDKITPINQSQISCTHKSNLKLTGSSNLSDSKKSERRVTFSETPSVSEAYKKPKYLPLAKQIKDSPEDAEDDLSDDSYRSVTEEIYKTAPNTHSEMEEKENQDNQAIILKDKCESSGTLWESALTKLDFNASNVVEPVNNQFNVSLQINVFNNTLKSVDDSNLNGNDVENTSLNKSTNIWSSMTNMVKSVVHNISVTAQNRFSNGIKRSHSETDASDLPSIKRMKLTELRCRRPIRDLRPLYHIRLARPQYADKSTQTDEIWMC